MHIVNLVCLLVINFAVLSVRYQSPSLLGLSSRRIWTRLTHAQSAALCTSLNATPAEDFFGQPSNSNLKAPDWDPYLPPLIIKSKKFKRASLDCMLARSFHSS